MFFLTLTAVLVVGEAIILNRGFEDELLAVQQRELRREIRLASSFLERLSTRDPDEAARELAFRMGYPVTLLDPEGRVVGASSALPFQLPGLRIPLESPELAAARAGDVGFARRRGSGEVEIRLFAAAPASLGGEPLILQVAVPLDEIRRAVRSRLRHTLLLAVPGVALAMGLALVLGRSLARPIQELADQARSISAGNFSKRITGAAGAREVQELAGTVNRLAEALASRFRALESERDEMQALIDCMREGVIALSEEGIVLTANQAAIHLLGFPTPVGLAPVGALVRQPALRSLLEDAVVRPFSSREVLLGDRSLIISSSAMEGGGAVVTFVDVTEVRRVEMVRRDFVANASHELKTPLTAILGFAETLMEDDLPEDLRRNWLGSIRSNTLRLKRLVDDLLDLSRLESGGWMAREEEVELEPLVQDLLSELEETARERKVALESGGSARVIADPQGVEQVLRNLLDNALRYTPESGAVSVVVEGSPHGVRVEVRDTGPGIPTSALNRIFERFYRVDPARSREEGGTGLGLAIVRHLVQAMGGEVWAESEMGRGTWVIFTLPGVETGKGVPDGEEE